MRLAWLSDLHLNFVGPDRHEKLFRQLQQQRPDAILIGGDTGEAESIVLYLQSIAERVDAAVYFVLGNHDFYHGSVAATRAAVRRISADVPNLFYLPETGVVKLTARTSLVGHDGWADGRYGDFWSNPLALNDYRLIAELARLDHAGRLAMLNQFGDEAACYLRAAISNAAAASDSVLVLTHVPPFWETCWYQRTVSAEEWVPHFACKAVGDMLLNAAATHASCRFTVFCGHTHNGGTASILPNLEVRVAAAEYGSPAVQETFAID
jgi:predicted MPP superfamily phosphohydrolase